ncbi:TPA: hypothetical protein NPN97_004009 [Klebsiella variicola subsp. variicola]|nr:hypothetical protein [Klebsiella variicola subsp. variicola]
MINGKRLFILALILACFSALASDAGRLQQALHPWHPLAVTRHHDTMTVILNEDRVTPARYEEVIGKGLCAGIGHRRAISPPSARSWCSIGSIPGVMFWWDPQRCATGYGRQPGSVRG